MPNNPRTSLKRTQALLEAVKEETSWENFCIQITYEIFFIMTLNLSQQYKRLIEPTKETIISSLARNKNPPIQQNLPCFCCHRARTVEVASRKIIKILYLETILCDGITSQPSDVYTCFLLILQAKPGFVLKCLWLLNLEWIKNYFLEISTTSEYQEFSWMKKISE